MAVEREPSLATARGAGKEPLPRRTEIPSRSERVIWAPVCLDLYLRNAQQDGPVGLDRRGR